MRVFVQLKPLKEIKQPTYATAGAAGMDCYLPTRIQLEPNERRLIPLGFAVGVPDGFELQVRPRSGYALKYGLIVANSPGTIDSDYRGEVGVILWNTSKNYQTFEEGDRICQLVLKEICTAVFEIVSELTETTRGEGGYGSTGK